jgi:site-specific DNA recombinase
VSGTTTRGRDGLKSLIDAAKRHPAPFDVLLVDDTSRLARNTEDALHTVAILKFYGVAVVSVTQGIDSRQKSARQLLTLHAMIDEEYVTGLASKVHRGQEGRVLEGYVAGGRCYGYRNVPIEDPTKLAKYGRPVILGVRAEIDEAQAVVVRRIFSMCADGMSLAQIAKTLNQEGVEAPQPARNRRERSWATTSIREILYNERYRGVQVWNRTRKERNPETGKKVSRPRPTEEWKRVDVPEWRIVPEELWDRAHASFAARSRQFASKLSASKVTRASTSKYLFSGLMVCGKCGANLVIVAGDGKRGYQKYGCPNHRYRGTCDNGVMIRQDRLETQLLSFLQSEILTEEMADYTAELFEKELNRRLSELAYQYDSYESMLQSLQRERNQLKAEAERIAKAIATTGHSPTLLKLLADSEEKIAGIEARIDAPPAKSMKHSIAEVRTYATKAIADLRSVLKIAGQKAKTMLARHVKQFVLTPQVIDGKLVYSVTGEWELLPESNCVIWMVARDGIEPPTPAFRRAAGNTFALSAKRERGWKIAEY